MERERTGRGGDCIRGGSGRFRARYDARGAAGVPPTGRGLVTAGREPIPMSMSRLAQYYNPRGLRSICLTFDTDWAPEFILADLVAVLASRGLRATFFATNPSPALERAAASGAIEVALHPNLNPGSSHGDTLADVIDRLRGWFPEAVGVRTHGLHQSSAMLRSLSRHGIRYDSSLQLCDHPFLQAFSCFFELVRIPYVWSDASHLLSRRPLDLEHLGLRSPGMKVLGFHPVLWFLNASTMAAYEGLKDARADLSTTSRDDVAACVESGPGLRGLFDGLCEEIARRGLATYTLLDLCDEFVAVHQPWSEGRYDGAYSPYLFEADERHP